MRTRSEAMAALYKLSRFIGRQQLRCLADLMSGEEKQFFYDKACELSETVRDMPETYGQDGKGDGAVIYLHYFTGGCDWWLTEKDSEPEQQQAFGLTDLGYGTELGYVSIVELLENGAELDLYYAPRTIAEQQRRGA